MAKLTENSGRATPAPITHRNEFPTGYSLAGCSPAEPASASPADLILQPKIPFAEKNSANGSCRIYSLSHGRAQSKGNAVRRAVRCGYFDGAWHAIAGAGSDCLHAWNWLRPVRFFTQRNADLPERRAAGGGRFTAQWLDAAGKAQPLLAKPDTYLYPRLSPDGTRLALSADDIWVYEWQRDIMTRLSFHWRSDRSRLN